MRKFFLFLLLGLVFLAACGKSTPKAALPAQYCDKASECVPCGKFCISKGAFSEARCGQATHNACGCEANTCIADMCQADTDCRACGTKCVSSSYVGGDCGSPSFSCMCTQLGSKSAKSVCEAMACTQDSECVACAEGCVPSSTLDVRPCTPDNTKTCGCVRGKCAERTG